MKIRPTKSAICYKEFRFRELVYFNLRTGRVLKLDVVHIRTVNSEFYYETILLSAGHRPMLSIVLTGVPSGHLFLFLHVPCDGVLQIMAIISIKLADIGK